MTTPFEKSKQTTKADRQEKYRKANHCIASILARIYAGEILSIKELAGECGVHLRTMQRYVNERLVEFPIRKEGDRFYLDRMENDRRLLSDEERAVLEMLDELSRKQGHDFYVKAHRVLKKLERQAANPYFVHWDGEDIGEMLEQAVKLERAVKKRRLVRCRYRMDRGTYDLDLKPLKIVNFKGFWYLLAMDARNDEVKKYLLRNISTIRQSDEEFTPPENLDEALARAMAVWFEPDAEPIGVRIFVDAYAAKYFERKALGPTQVILGRDADGSIEISVTITHEMELIPVVKQWMPHLRVLEPTWLEERIREDVQAWLNDESEGG